MNQEVLLLYRYMPKPLLIVDSYERDKAIRITLVNISKTDTPVRTIFSKVAIQTRCSFRKLSADIVDKTKSARLNQEKKRRKQRKKSALVIALIVQQSLHCQCSRQCTRSAITDALMMHKLALWFLQYTTIPCKVLCLTGDCLWYQKEVGAWSPSFFF